MGDPSASWSPAPLIGRVAQIGGRPPRAGSGDVPTHARRASGVDTRYDMCSFRVPDGMTPPSRAGDEYSSQLGLPTDDEGFFGRECPNADCLAYFKLHVDEYQEARDAGRLTCPVCGTSEPDDHFFTQDQLARLEAAKREFAQGAVNDILRNFARDANRRTRNSRFAKLTWNAPRPYVPAQLPTYVEKQTIRTFACPNGGHRAVIYDLVAFCPYCGPDATPPRAVFDDTVAAMGRLLEMVQAQPDEARAEITALGGATVLVERALTNLVAAAQNLAKQTHARAGRPPARQNPWQNVERLQKQWIADMGHDPLAALAPSDVATLRLAFDRRHLLEHNGGVADAKYVEETGDGVVGRKVRITPRFVADVVNSIERLAEQLGMNAQA